MGNIILFAVLGAVFYWIFSSYKRFSNAYSKESFKNMKITKESLENSDLGLFVGLVAKVAKADGKVDALEAQLVGIMFDDIAAVFPEPDKTKDILKQIFDEQKDRTDNIEVLAQTLGRAISRDKAKQQQFIGFLIQLAFIDGSVSESEEEVLTIIAQAFEIDPQVYHGIFDQFEKMVKNRSPQVSIEDSYKLLGVSENDDISTIKKAYRKLVREYHPDIIKSQNKDEAYLEKATIKTQEINEAYEMIKKAKK